MGLLLGFCAVTKKNVFAIAVKSQQAAQATGSGWHSNPFLSFSSRGARGF